MQHAKPALSIKNQLTLLEQRGMLIDDASQAAHALAHISYYRLRAYWLPYEAAINSASHPHRFKTGTRFSTILAVYEFDRHLRLHILDAIERIEISLRACFAQTLSLQHGPQAHEIATLFRDTRIWQTSLNELEKEYLRSKETFAQHHLSHYPELRTPPIWVASELMTLGHLSRWLKNLNSPNDRQIIASTYGLDEKVLVSFMHHLTVVRNHCAHHGRVWNRKLSLKMPIPHKKPIGLVSNFNATQDRLIYNTLTMLAFLVRQINHRSTWHLRIKELINATPEVCPKQMGFLDTWQALPVWKTP
jgi:abortive infection bacteriophage resistance protein